MKKLLSVILLIISISDLSGQSHGITYQAVIIDTDAQEIPGADITGNFLPNKALIIRFTIQSGTQVVAYQETQATPKD